MYPVYLQYALTPPAAKAIYPRGLQNVGYGPDFVELLRANLHRHRNIQMFGGYRLWGQLPSKKWELLEQCNNPRGVMYAEDPGCYRTPAGTANIERHIQQVWSVQGYAIFLNWTDPQDQCGLVEDPNFWREEYNITTAAQLAEHIGACHQRNMEKSGL